ncbi:hypothetical protein H8F21_15255 [Pseudomonas sp. P66]|uniref:Uncharacterized protein n=1 Tax=Pseudomonas arcuscaelestis TaxID=2710591 RepID=A0ABS2BZ68_9PSED|nr:hypothetical protein [Pseudomonas arcuscaelestis]MBM5458923.1 hypothetical protein [Pseudomonas arcuscaelestis]
MRLPKQGAEIEVRGVVGVYVGADVMTNGEVNFTIRAAASNVKLMETRCRAHQDGLQKINDNFVSVRSSACLWRHSPAGGFYDEEAQTMLGNTLSDHKASVDAQAFQEMLSLRNMAWARSR